MAQQRMNVQAPIERLFADRWSTRAFDPDKRVPAELLASCLEAARWAPSCFGAEPWHYIVADRFTAQAAWQRVLDALAPKNQLWAEHAPVLIVAVADPVFSHNGNPNRWAEYDTGQATVCLTLQAESLGLACHQMGGFDAETLKSALTIPEALQLMSVTAIGYAGDIKALDTDFQPMEEAARTRRSLADTVHNGAWGTAYHPPASAGWEARYQETSVEQLPWFHAGLDADISRALDSLELGDGATALDLGCGPGTQAVALAKCGLSVTASDVSWTAIASAERLAAAEHVRIDFHVDDVLHSKLTGQFDLIIDRGVFHCFADADDQQTYVSTLHQRLKPGATLLLKCFHKQETSETGPPGRYEESDISRFFADGFKLIETQESRFAPTAQDDGPKALFCILERSIKEQQ